MYQKTVHSCVCSIVKFPGLREQIQYVTSDKAIFCEVFTILLLFKYINRVWLAAQAMIVWLWQQLLFSAFSHGRQQASWLAVHIYKLTIFQGE